MVIKGARAAAAAVGVVVVVFAISSLPSLPHPANNLRRSLQAALLPEWEGAMAEAKMEEAEMEGGTPTVYPWARNHLRPLEAVPEPDKETVLFWHIPKSGGTTVKSIYECLGRTLANQAGADPRYGHDNTDEGIVAFRPWPGVSRASYVNVDTTNRQGILQAARMGLVPSGLANVIVTGDPAFAIENLYDEAHKGRVLALFRHPIDRLVSKFYYLQTATWERDYRPQWGHIDVLEFARTRNNDNNHIVKKLAGLAMDDDATEDDLRMAMRTIRKRFIVGLMHEMEESIHRFNVVLGIDETTPDNRECMDHFFHHSLGAKRHNSHEHPHVARGSPTWNALAAKNSLDIRLYESVLQLFEEQREIIDYYADSYADSYTPRS